MYFKFLKIIYPLPLVFFVTTLADFCLSLIRIMYNEGTILFEFGTEGGGATIYRVQHNKIIEKASSGGIVDEKEDPFKEWEEEFENWEVWWQNFTNKNKEFWIFYYPKFIHDDVKPFIQSAIDNYTSTNQDVSHHKEKWNRRLRNKEQTYRRKQ